MKYLLTSLIAVLLCGAALADPQPVNVAKVGGEQVSFETMVDIDGGGKVGVGSPEEVEDIETAFATEILVELGADHFEQGVIYQVWGSVVGKYQGEGYTHYHTVDGPNLVGEFNPPFPAEGPCYSSDECEVPFNPQDPNPGECGAAYCTKSKECHFDGQDWCAWSTSVCTNTAGGMPLVSCRCANANPICPGDEDPEFGGRSKYLWHTCSEGFLLSIGGIGHWLGLSECRIDVHVTKIN